MARHKKLILRDHPSDTKLLPSSIMTWSCVDVEMLNKQFQRLAGAAGFELTNAGTKTCTRSLFALMPCYSCRDIATSSFLFMA
jgi:hypothetical protein